MMAECEAIIPLCIASRVQTLQAKIVKSYFIGLFNLNTAHNNPLYEHELL